MFGSDDSFYEKVMEQKCGQNFTHHIVFFIV